jgi:hypothetical protein
MFDELLKIDGDEGTSIDPKEKTGNEEDAYEAGRTGRASLFDNDTESEAEARERGKEDRINAETTRKENKEADDE